MCHKKGTDIEEIFIEDDLIGSIREIPDDKVIPNINDINLDSIEEDAAVEQANISRDQDQDVENTLEKEDAVLMPGTGTASGKCTVLILSYELHARTHQRGNKATI